MKRRLNSGRRLTDAIKMLKDDHEKVKGLFREYDAAGDNATGTKRKIAATAFEEFEVHATISKPSVTA